MYPDSKSWDLNFPGRSQFQILCPNFPHKPSKCLKNSTLSVSKQHLSGLFLYKKAAQTFFFRLQSPISDLESVVGGALKEMGSGRKKPWQSALITTFRLGCFLAQWSEEQRAARSHTVIRTSPKEGYRLGKGALPT